MKDRGRVPSAWFRGSMPCVILALAPLAAIEYLASGGADKVTLEHPALPGVERGQNPYHYVVVEVDGGELRLEVIGVDWGRDYQPYRSRRANLRDER